MDHLMLLLSDYHPEEFLLIFSIPYARILFSTVVSPPEEMP